MVREQERPRSPSASSSTKAQPTAQIGQKTSTSIQPSDVQTTKAGTGIPQIIPTQPAFGVPSTLGASPQPFARTQPLHRPSHTSTQRQSGGHDGGHSSLFISSKSGARRPEFHKPQTGSNPLQSLHMPPSIRNPLKQMKRQESNQQPRSSDGALSDYDGEVFGISKPTAPQWQPKPIVQKTFSSQQNVDPHFKPQTAFVDLTVSDIGVATNAGLWAENYHASDPSIYLDTSRANEELQALFEGSIEDEDDKVKTRRGKKQRDAKAPDLADRLQGLNVAADAMEEPQGDEEDEDDGTVKGLKVKLLPHQIDGVAWMRSKELGNKKGKGRTSGGILADDMGLGKTIQSIALILTNQLDSADDADRNTGSKSEKCTLVVAPLALIKQWEGEIKDRVEKDHMLKVCVHHGPQRAKSYKELRKFDIVITTYQTLSSEHAASSESLKVGCFGLKWYRVMLDEAHSIKNRNAKVTKAACALDAKYRWCLTGTPMQNNLDELQSLIHFLQIGPLDKFEYWREQITRPMNNGRGGLAIKRLQAVLKNVMKRRTKDVLKQDGALRDGATDKQGASKNGFKIVKRTVEAVEAEFSEQERAFYQRLESRTDQRLEMMMAGNKMSYASALVLLMRLRQACNHPRLIGSDLAADSTGFADAGSQTPRKKAAAEDMDDIAAMLGGLSVETKLCDVCQIELSKDDIQKGVLRCEECEKDLTEQMKTGKDKREKKKDKKALIKNDRKVRRHVIIDSDDEDDENPKSNAVDLTSSDREDSEEEDDDDDDDEDSEYESDGESSEPEFVASTKIRHLLNILRNDAHNHKHIVFSFFTSMLDLIEPFLYQSHIKFVRYDGSMRNDMREASLSGLRDDPTVRVLLCSLRAGSLGLNLTAASRVVILEPFWNPFVEEQAIDRVHRLNQTQDVVVYKLTIKDTVEARILELQEKKRELAKVTVEANKLGKGAAAKLTLQDMMKLFSHGAERDAKLDMVGMKDSKSLLDRSESTHDQYSRSSTEDTDDRRNRGGTEREKARRNNNDVYGRRW